MIDVSSALILLPVLSPVLIGIATISCFVHRGKILFRQERVGRYGKTFRMLKFRTMIESYDTAGSLLDDEARTTRFGRFLRNFSLDELPQIGHVITGKMSFVGPRPLLPEHVSGGTPAESLRHELRPGITGLAQVKGRNDIPFSDRFRYDVWYVRHVNPGVDSWIVWNTVRVVFRNS